MPHDISDKCKCDKPPKEKLGTAIHELFKPLGGVELEIPPREPMPEPPKFD